MTNITIMEQEAKQAPQIIAKQLQTNKSVIQAICHKLQKNPPPFALTIGRGSSDHACTFAKYLLETEKGLVTASAAPSTVSLYEANLNLNNALVIGVSQSGKSPDICSIMEAAKKQNATTIAIVNDINSPLAQLSEFVVPLCAGAENAVAATKSYISSLTAITHLTAVYSQNNILLEKLHSLPESLEEALTKNWDNAIDNFTKIQKTLVIARGYGFPIAQEAALKFKETASIQAEAFSAAEVLHGPFALIKKDQPYLLFAQNDVTLNGILDLSKKIKKLGGNPILAMPETNKQQDDIDNICSLLLSLPKSLHPILDPIMVIQKFYIMAAKIAVARGYNPDSPDNLQKITQTL